MTEQQTILIFSCWGERWSLESRYQQGAISMTQYYQQVSALYSNPNCTQQVTQTIQVPLNGESDGIVPLRRQILPNAPYEVLDGVNHAELKDHPTTTARFNSLFNGGLNLLDFGQSPT